MMRTEPGGVVSKVGRLLRELSGETEGVATTELARRAGLPRPTAHRLLADLLDEGLVDRDRDTGLWWLGPEAYLMGLSASMRYEVPASVRAAVRELSDATGESAFYSVARGQETVCLVRQDGSFPLRSHVLHEGIRLPFGVGSAGLALLAHRADGDIAAYLDAVDLAQTWGEGHARAELEGRIRRTRLDGYATNPGLIVEGSWGFAAAVFDGRGHPRAALSLTGVSTRFGDDRRGRLGRLLLQVAHRLGDPRR